MLDMYLSLTLLNQDKESMFYAHIHLISEFEATTDNSFYWFVKNIVYLLFFPSCVYTNVNSLSFRFANPTWGHGTGLFAS